MEASQIGRDAEGEDSCWFKCSHNVYMLAYAVDDSLSKEEATEEISEDTGPHAGENHAMPTKGWLWST